MREGSDIRGIKRTYLFNEQVEDLIPDARRADEFMEGAEWTLSRNPREGLTSRSSIIRLVSSYGRSSRRAPCRALLLFQRSLRLVHVY